MNKENCALKLVDEIILYYVKLNRVKNKSPKSIGELTVGNCSWARFTLFPKPYAIKW